MDRYIQWVIRRRRFVVAFCLALTLLCGFVLTRGVFATSLINAFLGDSPAYTHYRTLTDRFGDGEIIVIAYTDRRLFEDDGWSRLEGAVTDLERLEFVRRVTALPNVYRVRGGPLGLDVQTYADLRRVAPEGLAELALADDSVRGALIARDGCCTAVIVEVLPYDDVPVEELPRWMEALEAPFLERGLSADEVHVAGLVPETVEALAQTRLSIRRILPIAALILLLVVYLLFRQLWPVVVTYGVAIVAMVWTAAFAVLIEPQINVMMAMVPTVMLTVAFSDVVHLFSSYLRELETGASKAAAIRRAGSEVGLACVYTSLTTGVGFAAMALVPAPVFRNLALVLGVGVALALSLSMTLVPICLHWLPEPRLHPSDRVARLLGAVVEASARTSLRHPKLTIALFAVGTVVCLVGASNLTIEMSMLNRLNAANTLRVDQRYMAAHFDGTTLLDVYLTAESGDLIEPERFAAIEAFQRGVAQIDGVDAVRSVVDLLETIHRELGGDPGGKSQGQLAQALFLYEMAGAEGLDQLIDTDYRTMRLSLRLASTDMARAAAIGAEARRLGATLEGVEVVPSGLTFLVGEWLAELIAGQRRGLLLALLATTLAIVILLRRVRIGLIAMIPNALPLLVLGGVAGWVWGRVDANILLIAMIAVGIAVDDTIHFLTRLRIETDRERDVGTTLTRTLTYAGRPMVETTVILCLGFLPFAMSEHTTTQMMGTLMPLALAVALVADLLLLPALGAIGLLRFEPTRPRSSPHDPAE